MRRFIFCVPDKILFESCVIKSRRVLLGGTCGSNGGENKLIQWLFSGRNQKERDHVEELSMDREVTLKYILKLGLDGTDWIGAAQNSDKWKYLISWKNISFSKRTYLLTPWSKVLLEKLTGTQVDKKFTAFYGIRRFITAFASARHLSLS
jgi:hypothetical protein